MKKTILILTILSLVGCAVGNDIFSENNRHTTIGQELIDLKKSYDEKVITIEEYDKLKQDIKDSASFSYKIEKLDSKEKG